jgi:hypothetical protein
MFWVQVGILSVAVCHIGFKDDLAFTVLFKVAITWVTQDLPAAFRSL